MNTAAMYNKNIDAVKMARAHRTKSAENAQNQLAEGGFHDSASLNRDLFYFTGCWLCSGSLRPAWETGDQERYDLFVTLPIDMKGQDTKLPDAVVNISERLTDYLRYSPAPCGLEVLIHAPALDEWLEKHFRQGDRLLPDWIYDMPEESRKALLDGLIDGTALRYTPTCRFFMVDKQHVFEIKKLAETLGYAPTVHAGLPDAPVRVEIHCSDTEQVFTIDLNAPVCRTENDG